MAQRATVQQAVELLKIYQLRRENSLIFQQISSLKDEIAAMRTSQDTLQTQNFKIQESISIINTNLSQQGLREQGFALNIRTLTQTQDQIKAFMQNLQSEHEKHLEKTLQWQQDMIKRLDKLGVREQQSENGKNAHLKFPDQISHSIQNRRPTKDDAASKMRTQDLVLAEGLIGVQQDVVPSQMSRVVDSYENQVRISLSTDRICEQSPNLQNEHNIEPTEYGCNDTSLVDDSTKPESPGVPNDIDLDEAADRISYAGHHLGFSSPGSSLCTLPQDAFYEHGATSHVIEPKLDRCEANTASQSDVFFNKFRGERKPGGDDAEKANTMVTKELKRKPKLKQQNNSAIATGQANLRRSQRIAEKTGKDLPQIADQGLDAPNGHLTATNDEIVTQMNFQAPPNTDCRVIVPVTPRKRPIVNERSRLNPMPVQPTSKRACTQAKKLRSLQGDRSRESSPICSPYDPKPRLVESIRRGQRHSSRMTVDEPSLPAPLMGVQATKVSDVLRCAGKLGADQRSRKRRKRTPSLPPSIPILSTSSDAGEQFRAWGC